MKLLCISHTNISGQEGDSTHIREIALNLQKEGNNLLLICKGGRQNIYPINVVQLPSLEIKYLTSLFLDLLSIPYLFFYIKRFKPDIVYYREVATAGIVSWLFKVPSVAEANGIYPDLVKMVRPRFFKIAGTFLQLRERFQYFFATRIICVTDGIKRELVRNYGVKEKRCKVIHNGVNIQLFRPLNKVTSRNKLGINQDYFYIGFLGSFKVWRGLENLIEALKKVKERGYDQIKCFLIGDGYLMSHLKEMVNRYDLSKNIIFKGSVNYEGAPIFINSFDICYLCWTGLKYGSSALKLFEYLACARPVIASRVEGDREIVKNGNCGYLFKAGDVESLVSRIIESYDLRDRLPELGRNGRRFIKDQFSWEKVANRLQNVLLEVIKEKKSSHHGNL